MNMKIYNLKNLCLLLLFAFSISSCKKVLDVNTDPNNPSTSTPQLVMPSGQAMLAATVGNTWGYIGSMWAQYWTGGYGVSSSQLEYYNMVSADVEGGWTRAYARTLEDFYYLIKSDQPVHAGMAKIMSAYLYQMLVDVHGDIPFTEALKGEAADGGITAPKYDKEQAVYDALIPMINEGIAGLDATGGLVTPPSSEDLIYGGDIDKWKVFANTLKLKILVRRGDYTAAKSLMDAGTVFISDANDEAKFEFFETGQNTNPLWARFQSRTTTGMYYVGTSASVTKLEALADPRLSEIYVTGNAGHEGVDAGDINDNTTKYPSGGSNNRFDRPISDFSGTTPTKTYGPKVPVFFISAWESYFLQAEVLTRLGLDGSTLLESAIQASFDYYGVGSAAAYTTTLGYGAASTEDRVDILAIQKWISMNGLQMCEGWLETVRFDRPGHNVFSGGIFTTPINTTLAPSTFPSSFVYPTQETSYNSNTPAGRTVSSKRFWDI